jgi:hypothetical protein
MPYNLGCSTIAGYLAMSGNDIYWSRLYFFIVPLLYFVSNLVISVICSEPDYTKLLWMVRSLDRIVPKFFGFGWLHPSNHPCVFCLLSDRKGHMFSLLAYAEIL